MNYKAYCESILTEEMLQRIVKVSTQRGWHPVRVRSNLMQFLHGTYAAGLNPEDTVKAIEEVFFVYANEEEMNCA